MGIPMLVRWHLYIESGARTSSMSRHHRSKHTKKNFRLHLKLNRSEAQPQRDLILNVVLSRTLTHWGRVTHICVGKLTIIGSDNDLSPERRQAIIWTNAGILLFGPLGTNFSEILIEIQTFSLKKIRLKMSSAKCCSFRLGLNVLISLSTHLSPEPPVPVYQWGISDLRCQSPAPLPQYIAPNQEQLLHWRSTIGTPSSCVQSDWRLPEIGHHLEWTSMSVWVIKFNSLFLDSRQRGPHNSIQALDKRE